MRESPEEYNREFTMSEKESIREEKGGESHVVQRTELIATIDSDMG